MPASPHHVAIPGDQPPSHAAPSGRFHLGAFERVQLLVVLWILLSETFALEEEVEFVRLYLEIEQARFGEALRITYDLHPDTLRARVPHLLIQPLVENAVKHGLRPRGGTGQVLVSARRAGAFLEVTVADDGVGPAHGTPEDGTGTGLGNVRERLRQMYGAEHAFELVPTPGGGATARIRIPFSDQPAPRPAEPSARALEAV